MIVNQEALLEARPLHPMVPKKMNVSEGSYGLSEAGYDVRIRQTIYFKKGSVTRDGVEFDGRFVLASTQETLDMPSNLVGIVHDKSSWARRGLSVFNTVVEPGFIGGLTLELVYHGQEELLIPAGVGIAQIIFHEIRHPASYNGKYQFQSTDPTEARKV